MSAQTFEENLLPQFFPAHWLKGAPEIVHSQFPSRIRIGYVRRIEGSYSYLMGPDNGGSNVAKSELHLKALANLDSRPMPDMKVALTPGGPEAYLVEAEDNFGAARLLLPRVQRALVKELGSDFLVAVPCRDWFFCWSNKQSKDWAMKNCAEARSIFLEDEYNLTPDILRFADGHFLLEAEQADA